MNPFCKGYQNLMQINYLPLYYVQCCHIWMKNLGDLILDQTVKVLTVKVLTHIRIFEEYIERKF